MVNRFSCPMDLEIQQTKLKSAEREGFEPPVPIPRYNGFQDRRIQPLCHLS